VAAATPSNQLQRCIRNYFVNTVMSCAYFMSVLRRTSLILRPGPPVSEDEHKYFLFFFFSYLLLELCPQNAIRNKNSIFRSQRLYVERLNWYSCETFCSVQRVMMTQYYHDMARPFDNIRIGFDEKDPKTKLYAVVV
jgi:hypothetical protein